MTERIVPGCRRIGLGAVNACLLDTGGDRLVLVDTGLPFTAGLVARAVRASGHELTDVGDILLTHQHVDHAGGLVRLVRETGARVWVHALDAPEIRAGLPPRPSIGRGFFTRLSARFNPSRPVGPAEVAHELVDGEGAVDELGLQVVHTPGHTAGHCSFFWPAHGGVLFAGDAAANWFGRLSHAPVAENWQAVDDSITRLAELQFSVAVFGHGRVLRGDALGRFRRFAERVAGG